MGTLVKDTHQAFSPIFVKGPRCSIKDRQRAIRGILQLDAGAWRVRGLELHWSVTYGKSGLSFRSHPNPGSKWKAGEVTAAAVDATSRGAGASGSDGLAVRPPRPTKIYPDATSRGLSGSHKVGLQRRSADRQGVTRDRRPVTARSPSPPHLYLTVPKSHSRVRAVARSLIARPQKRVLSIR